MVDIFNNRKSLNHLILFNNKRRFNIDDLLWKIAVKTYLFVYYKIILIFDVELPSEGYLLLQSFSIIGIMYNIRISFHVITSFFIK